jgi:hypothetical protein
VCPQDIKVTHLISVVILEIATSGFFVQAEIVTLLVFKVVRNNLISVLLSVIAQLYYFDVNNIKTAIFLVIRKENLENR